MTCCGGWNLFPKKKFQGKGSGPSGDGAGSTGWWLLKPGAGYVGSFCIVYFCVGCACARARIELCARRLANLSALCVFQMPDHFDQAVVLNQLRYSGMLETVRIRKAGYAVRRPFQDFYKRQDQRLRTSSFSSEGWGKRGSDGKT